MTRSTYALIAALALAPAVASAGAIGGKNHSASGSHGGMSWSARSRIIGQTPTAPGGGGPGGDPLYLGFDKPGYSGTVQLLQEYSDGSLFVCSGSLLSNNRILTAAHCVGSGGSEPDADLVGVDVYFYDSTVTGNTDPYMLPVGSFAQDAGVTGISVDPDKIFVNPNYTGEVIDQNDIAILKLSEDAPAWAEVYDIYTGGDLTGDQFNVTGYGTRSNTGGATGGNEGVGFLRQGDNIYDYALGDGAFGGFWDGFFGTADIEYSYVSDFDNGSAGNDAACIVAAAVGAPAGFGCNTGISDLAREVGIDGGDSGGAAFINGMVASVNSYGLTFGSNFGDFDDALNSSWGEFSGYVPTFIHADWIESTRFGVPEPSIWALLLGGLGAFGIGRRRKRRA